MPITFEDLLNRKKPVTDTVEIPLDPGLAEELEDARKTRDVSAARAAVRQNDTEAQAQAWEAEEKVLRLEQRLRDEDAVAYFTFQAIGRAAYEAIVAAHPASAEQRIKLKRLGLKDDIVGQVAWDEETFPPAIVAACLVEPNLTEDEVVALWRSDCWNQAELSKLVIAAIKINGTSRVTGLGKDSRKTLPSGRS